MIKALWFALRIGLFVAAAVWVVDQPGDVRVDWKDYTFTFQLGFFMLLVIVAILLSIFVYRVLKTFIDFPRSLSRYNQIRRKEKGYEALTIGLTAVAAGDTKAAMAQAKKTKKYLPEDTGLPLLLQAQAARLDGREDDAAKSFALLLEDKNASFLGVRGLLQRALDSDDTNAAMVMAEKALSLHPKQRWILKIVYDLQIRSLHWSAALETLARAEKAGAIDKAQARSDRTAILLAQADADQRAGHPKAARDKIYKALKNDPGFAPAALRLVQSYENEGNLRKARQTIEKTWKVLPHPDLVEAWDDLIDAKKADDWLYRVRWIEKLVEKNESSAQGWLKMARAALQAGLWGDTRAFLDKAQAIEVSAELYKLHAELGARTSGSPEMIRENLQRASAAPANKAWVCKETGRVYHTWMPVVPPHGAFNSLVWEAPGSGARAAEKKADMAEALIEAPAAA